MFNELNNDSFVKQKAVDFFNQLQTNKNNITLPVDSHLDTYIKKNKPKFS